MEIKVLMAKNDEKILKVGNCFINSSYNPSREAENFIRGYRHLLKDNIIHVIGLGLGYHIEEIINNTTDGQIIKVLDINNNLAPFTIEEINKLKKNKRIRIYTEQDVESFFTTINQSQDIIINKACLKVCENLEVKRLIEHFMISRESIRKFSSLMIENERENLSLNSPLINEFIRKSKSKIKVIASAGPSLDDVIEDLKKYRQNYEIYSVGSALKTLINNDIYPDLIVIIDPQEIVYNQIKGYENLNIPLAYLSTASRWVVSNYKGDKYIFYNKQNDGGIEITTGKTVAVATIDLAIKSGAEKIILVGQDLAYKENKTHSKSFEEIYNVEDKVIIDNNTKKVIGVSGEMLNTNKGYLIFKENIEKIIEKNNKVEFYNCSFGAYIIGAKNTSLKNVMENN